MKNKIQQISALAMRGFSILGLIFFACCVLAQAQATTFTYQGRLTVSSASASGTFDLEFKLFDAGGTQIGAAQIKEDVVVTNGVFTVQLDADLFEANAFNGGERLLEIGVRRGTETGDFTTLTPRQPVTSTPYAVRSLNAATADLATNAAQLGGTEAKEFVQTSDTRLTDSRQPTSGSGFYIQNQNSAAQSSANFNISGDGTLGGTVSANSVNSTTGFNIGGSRVLSFDNDNLLAGANAGANMAATGNSNSFFGSSAGRNNTMGSRNSFVGNNAGFNNTAGSNNSFFGLNAALINTTGSFNTLIGSGTSVGAGNFDFASAFGSFARVNANDTIVIGKTEGIYNGVTRPADAVQIPGSLSVSGTFNASGANLTNLNASNIASGTLDVARLPNFDASIITAGTFDNARIPNLDAGKITSGAFDATRIPSLDAGKITTGVFDATRIPNFDASKITSGTFSDARLSSNVATLTGTQTFTGAKTFSGGISGSGAGLTNLNAANLTGVTAIANGGTGSATQNFVDLTNAQTIGGSKTFSGILSGGVVNSSAQYNIGNSRVLSIPGTNNLFVGGAAGLSDQSSNNNSFVGSATGFDNTTGSGNSFVGSNAGGRNQTGGGNSFFGSFAGETNRTGSNNTIIGANANVNSANLSYATAIGAGSSVLTDNTIGLGRINGSDTVFAYGKIKLGSISLGGSANLCRNSDQEISFCSSSLRYKTNIAPFSFGLNLVKQLKPISFDWKTDSTKDVGFGAEDVAAINPLFVNYNQAGQVEGVKYDRLSVLFVNAFKEQQTQIERQQKQIDELKQLVCAIKPDAEVCKMENK